MQSMVLVFDFLHSIRREHQQGILSRNIAQYKRFLDEGDFARLYWFTYDRKDEQLLEELRRDDPFWNHVTHIMPPKMLHNRVGAAN